jgi:hypothetical protein
VLQAKLIELLQAKKKRRKVKILKMKLQLPLFFEMGLNHSILYQKSLFAILFEFEIFKSINKVCLKVAIFLIIQRMSFDSLLGKENFFSNQDILSNNQNTANISIFYSDRPR